MEPTRSSSYILNTNLSAQNLNSQERIPNFHTVALSTNSNEGEPPCLKRRKTEHLPTITSENLMTFLDGAIREKKKIFLNHCLEFLAKESNFDSFSSAIFKSLYREPIYLHLLDHAHMTKNWDLYNKIWHHALQLPNWTLGGFYKEIKRAFTTSESRDATIRLSIPDKNGAVAFPSSILIHKNILAHLPFFFYEFSECQKSQSDCSLVVPFHISASEVDAIVSQFLFIAYSIVALRKMGHLDEMRLPEFEGDLYPILLLLDIIGERGVLSNWFENDSGSSDLITEDNYLGFLNIACKFNFPKFKCTIITSAIKKWLEGNLSDKMIEQVLKKHGTVVSKLNIIESNITDEQLALLLKYCPNLESLSLEKSAHITNKSLSHFQELPALQEVNFSFCPGITDETFGYMPKSLTCLGLICCPVTAKGIESLASIPLKSLAIMDGPYKLNRQIDTEFLDAISSLSSLKNLSLNGSHFSPDCIWNKLPAQLQTLDLSCVNSGLNHFPKNNLKSVSIDKSNISFPCLEMLIKKNDTRLKSLSFKGASINKKGQFIAVINLLYEHGPFVEKACFWLMTSQDFEEFMENLTITNTSIKIFDFQKNCDSKGKPLPLTKEIERMPPDLTHKDEFDADVMYFGNKDTDDKWILRNNHGLTFIL